MAMGWIDVIVGAYNSTPLNRSLQQVPAMSYMGKQGGYLYPIDLGSLNANEGVII